MALGSAVADSATQATMTTDDGESAVRNLRPEDLQGRRCPSRARQRQVGVTDSEAPLMPEIRVSSSSKSGVQIPHIQLRSF